MNATLKQFMITPKEIRKYMKELTMPIKGKTFFELAKRDAISSKKITNRNLSQRVDEIAYGL